MFSFGSKGKLGVTSFKYNRSKRKETNNKRWCSTTHGSSTVLRFVATVLVLFMGRYGPTNIHVGLLLDYRYTI